MITFLPYPDFFKSASVLDYRRLGKQRSEVKQLVQGHLGLGSPTSRRHPASIMWRGFTPALIEYGIAICEEWRRRGYSDSVGEYLAILRQEHGPEGSSAPVPPWVGVDCFHRSHRSRLVFKDPGYYRDVLGWADDPLQPYLWPLRAVSGGHFDFRYGATNGIVSINWWGDAWNPQSNL